jgi:hypothetical protein
MYMGLTGTTPPPPHPYGQGSDEGLGDILEYEHDSTPHANLTICKDCGQRDSHFFYLSITVSAIEVIDTRVFRAGCCDTPELGKNTLTYLWKIGVNHSG